MSTPPPDFATSADLRTGLTRYDAEARPGAFHTGRYHLRYVSWGDGPPVVFVHGMCDMARSFALVMTRLVDAGFRVVGYELADGRGDGAHLGTYRHEHFSADLIALLDHLDLPQVHVVGSSFGSTVVLRALADSPSRFRRAAVQGGFARRPLLRIERGLAMIGRSWPWRMGELPIRDAVMSRLEKPKFAGAADDVFAFLLANSGRTPVRAAARRGLILDRLDLRPRLGAIPHPLLMIGGDRDAIVPRRYEAEVEAGVKDVRRVEFAPCGHYPQYTLPGPAARALAAFFR